MANYLYVDVLWYFVPRPWFALQPADRKSNTSTSILIARLSARNIHAKMSDPRESCLRSRERIVLDTVRARVEDQIVSSSPP